MLDVSVLIQAVSFSEELFSVHLTDGRVIAIPYWWFPRLAMATSSDRQKYVLRRNGHSVWWDDLDEMIGVEGVVEGKADITNFARQWRKKNGYEWFDVWYHEYKLTQEQKTRAAERNRQWQAQENITAPDTLLRGTDLLEELSEKYHISISKQRLGQLTKGETQHRNGKQYDIPAKLQPEVDFTVVKGKIRYTPKALHTLQEIYASQRHGVSK
jgi:hypothetical protein